MWLVRSKLARGVQFRPRVAQSARQISSCVLVLCRAQLPRTSAKELQGRFNDGILDQGYHRITHIQAIIGPRHAHRVFTQHGGDQALGRQFQMSQDMLDSGTAFIDFDFVDTDLPTRQHGARDYGPRVQEP